MLLRLFVAIQVCWLVAADEFDNPRKYCGKTLAATMSIICNGKYQPMAAKRSDEADNIGEYNGQEYFTDIPYRYRSLGFQERFPFGSSAMYQRVRRGIIDECCWNPCSYKTLLKYCARK